MEPNKNTSIFLKHYDRSNWKKVRLGDIGYFLSGAGFPIVYQGKTKGQIPFLKVSDFSLEANKDFLTKANNYISNEVREKLHASIIPTGSIVFAKIGAAINLERKRMNKLPICIDNNMMAFVPTGVSNDFICHVFQTITLSNFVSATALPSLSSKVLGNIVVMLPENLETQQRISNTLVTINNHISNLERLISKQEHIKKTTLKLLLTPKADWNKITLGEVCDITGAGVDKKINPNEDKCILLNYLDVYHKTYIYSSDLHHIVSAPKRQKLRCSVKKHDIFFTPSSETPEDIARSCVIMEDMQDVAYSYHIVRARPKIECNSLFIKYICSTENFLQQAQTACVGSGKRYVISLPKFREFVIRLPEIEQQDKIAQILKKQDQQLEILHLELDKYRNIKKGLMDYFFG